MQSIKHLKVLDLISSPPAVNPYQHLKDRLLHMFDLNDYAHAEAIANLPLTGDMQPSNLMSRMLGLLPNGYAPCYFLRAAFLKCLPANVRAHLVPTASPILSPWPSMQTRSSGAVCSPCLRCEPHFFRPSPA